jgi:hypothetical protein
MFHTKVVEKIKTHILGSITSENCAVCEVMWNNMVQPDRPKYDTIIQSMHSACRITKVTEAEEYVIYVLIAFAL